MWMNKNHTSGFLNISYEVKCFVCSLCCNSGSVWVHPGYPDGCFGHLRYAGHLCLPNTEAPGGSGAHWSAGTVCSGDLPVTMCGICVDARLALWPHLQQQDACYLFPQCHIGTYFTGVCRCRRDWDGGGGGGGCVCVSPWRWGVLMPGSSAVVGCPLPFFTMSLLYLPHRCV